MVINSIEFHEGTNPSSGESRLARTGERHEEIGANGERVVSTRLAGDPIHLVITDVIGQEHIVNLIEQDGWYVARDGDGGTVARMDSEGNIESPGLQEPAGNSRRPGSVPTLRLVMGEIIGVYARHWI